MVSGYSDVTDSKTIGPMAVGRLAKCSHTFHLLCLLAMYYNGNKVPMAPGPGGGIRGSRAGSPSQLCCTLAGDWGCPVRSPGPAQRPP